MNIGTNTQDGSQNDVSESSDGEDQEESSNFKEYEGGESGESSLANFRQEWQKELQELKHRKANLVKTPIRNVRESQVIEDDSDEIKAKKLFMKGIEMERSKKMYEAIQFYRRAVQLVPDIEFRLEESFKTKARIENDEDKQDYAKITKQDEDCTDDIDSDDEIDESTFLQRIERKVNKNHFLCIPKVEQKGMHISELPTEILLYILRWVVSSDLDLRSLEMFAQSCRGFYLCARDQKIWRLACERAWGLNCGTLMSEYSSWREMFLERARLHFNGCYISKTTYIRQGESSFQDQFYRPWHVVTFYRYFRFFPEGLVFMLTTPDEPSQCISLLKHRQAKGPSILKGHYRLKDNTVTMVLHRQENVKSSYRRGQRSRTIA
ncbi:F-box-like [Popillia japonica]|uniref:F-box only protein 9 n=1 Tax=Popillia japonica TaxID=7064 RepID=A0AAW1N7B2_POPJA